MESIPFVAHESALHRLEKANRRVWILCIILVAALILTNLAWLIYEKQFETVEETTETVQTYDVMQDGIDGNLNNIIGGEGNTINGTTENSGNNP